MLVGGTREANFKTGEDWDFRARVGVAMMPTIPLQTEPGSHSRSHFISVIFTKQLCILSGNGRTVYDFAEIYTHRVMKSWSREHSNGLRVRRKLFTEGLRKDTKFE